MSEEDPLLRAKTILGQEYVPILVGDAYWVRSTLWRWSKRRFPSRFHRRFYRELKTYIERSITDQSAWDTLIDVMKVLHRGNAPIPESLQRWVNDVVTGERSRPRKEGRPKADRYKDVQIGHAVIVLQSGGMSLRKAYKTIGSEVHKSDRAIEKAHHRSSRSRLGHCALYPGAIVHFTRDCPNRC